MGSLNINVGFKGQKKTKGYRFKDLAIPIGLTYTTNNISSFYDLDAVKNSIRNLFRWVKGQRVLEPEYGNPLLDILYELMNAQTETRARRQIIERLQRWEPRVQVQNIDIKSDVDNQTYFIIITFSVPDLDITNATVEIIK